MRPENEAMLEILPESHVDHVDQAVLDHLVARYQNKANPDRKTIVETIELPVGMDVECGLFGPAMGDPPVSEAGVTYRPRNGRAWPSRLIAGTPRRTRKLTVVMGEYGDHELVLYTTYGGPSAPPEPSDPNKQPASEESLAFWCEHALCQ